jgi:hypothetical protein
LGDVLSDRPAGERDPADNDEDHADCQSTHGSDGTISDDPRERGSYMQMCS